MKESEYIDVDVGYQEFQYTLQDLQRLRECIALNGGAARGLMVFWMDSKPQTDARFVLQAFATYADKIASDSGFPEKHFSDHDKSKTEFVISTCVTRK